MQRPPSAVNELVTVTFLIVARRAVAARIDQNLSTDGLVSERRFTMLYWALMFLLVALVAGVLGFGGVAGTAAWIAQVLFVVFLVLFIVSLLSGGIRRPIP